MREMFVKFLILSFWFKEVELLIIWRWLLKLKVLYDVIPKQICVIHLFGQYTECLYLNISENTWSFLISTAGT